MSQAAILAVHDLQKHFGGVSATDGVSFEVLENEVHALIGPNGAGKTTLLSQLTGELTPDSGRIEFRGENITAAPAHHRSHLGLARSFQITSIFKSMSVLDNVALAVQAHAGHSFRFWQRARRDHALRDPASAFLAQVGLDARAEEVAANLSHGEQRQLEIAMALATEPSILLLDEPMAGMGPDESTEMVSLLGRLRESTTILLVEHDMDAVFALADRISVLVYGKIIASDTPSAIRNDRDVQQAYLGELEQ